MKLLGMFGGRSVEKSFRPSCLAEIIGQAGPKALFQIHASASRVERRPFPNILIVGQKGDGKSTFAFALANELRREVVDLFGPTVAKVKELSMALSQLKGDEIVFIDEIHALDKKAQEILLPLVEDHVLKVIVDGQRIERQMPQLTVIAATTDEGLVLGTLFDRFTEHVLMDLYSLDELAEIVCRAVKRKNNWDLPRSISMTVAMLSQRNPRVAINLLKSFEATVLAQHGRRIVDEEKLLVSLRYTTMVKGLCPLLGLDASARSYLAKLESAGSPMGISSVAQSLGIAASTIETKVEPSLLIEHAFTIGQQLVRGPLVMKDGSGRQITQVGRQYLAACRVLRDRQSFMLREAF